MEGPTKRIALTGDVGGTNIRLELLSIDINQNTPTIIKQARLDVAKYDVFQNSIEFFLQGITGEDYPTVAVIGIAGPISENTVFLANVGKWGVLDGSVLGTNLKIKHFVFLNDFEAASYGVLTVPENQFVSINGLQVNPNKVRGIIGPGTGLGNSVLFPLKHKDKTEIIVIPSEGGHTDFPSVDDQAIEYSNFFKKESGYSYISLERLFCGPSLPYMYRFFCAKYPQDPEASGPVPSSQKIMEVAVGNNPPRIHDSVFKLFIRIYSSAIANFVTQHLTVGGMYLVGGLTKSILPRIVGTDLFKGFKERHPQILKLIENVPLSVCNEVELGLKGAYYKAKQIFKDNV